MAPASTHSCWMSVTTAATSRIPIRGLKNWRSRTRHQGVTPAKLNSELGPQVNLQAALRFGGAESFRPRCQLGHSLTGLHRVPAHRPGDRGR